MNELKQVRYGELEYLNEFQEMDREEFKTWCEQVLNKMDEAEQGGLTTCKVSLQSTLDPYDGVTGPVEVEITGFRDKNKAELAAEARDVAIRDLAKKLGLSYYEASVLERLPKNKLKALYE